MPEHRTYGIPDLELTDGVNPSDFAGHDLVMLFCPDDTEAAAQELADYNALADQLAYNDAYMVAVCSKTAEAPASRVLTARDAEGRAWDAFSKCLSPHMRPAPAEGAVFLFGRGGCLRQVWPGSGHAKEVVQALNERM